MIEAAHAQRLAALEVGNAARANRAELKRKLASGEVNLPRLLMAPPPWATAMRLEQVLHALPSFGKVKASKMTRRLGISPTRQIGSLTPAERVSVCRYLNHSHPSTWSRVAVVGP